MIGRGLARRLFSASLLSELVMVQYYTLEQAAKILQTTPEKVKEMAKKNEVRAFKTGAVYASAHRKSTNWRAAEASAATRL